MVIERLKAWTFDRALVPEARVILSKASDGRTGDLHGEALAMTSRLEEATDKKSALARVIAEAVIAEADRERGVAHDDVLNRLQKDLVAAIPIGHAAIELSLAARLLSASLWESVVIVCDDLLSRQRQTGLLAQPKIKERVRYTLDHCHSILD